MVLNIFDYFGIIGILIGLFNLFLLIRYMINVPDELKRIADALDEMNRKE